MGGGGGMGEIREGAFGKHAFVLKRHKAVDFLGFDSLLGECMNLYTELILLFEF